MTAFEPQPPGRVSGEGRYTIAPRWHSGYHWVVTDRYTGLDVSQHRTRAEAVDAMDEANKAAEQ